jgi:hypothetical protein
VHGKSPSAPRQRPRRLRLDFFRHSVQERDSPERCQGPNRRLTPGLHTASRIRP